MSGCSRTLGHTPMSRKQHSAKGQQMAKRDWFVDYIDEDTFAAQISEYDITASPNDFNIGTIYHFIESGSLKIPAFQRNYVWDIKRASKLVESILIGLSIPQIFLYEKARN